MVNAQTPKLTDPKMIEEANDFALTLVQNKTLLLAWFNMLAKALKEKQYEVAIMDNFIAEESVNKVKSWDTTYGYVIQAQQKLAAYKIYYWSGLYKTSKRPKGSSSKPVAGEPISVVGSGSKTTAPFVSLAKAELIGYQFKDLVLSWGSEEGLNPSTGNLIFGVRNISGVATKTFAGTISENGSELTYAGIMTNPKSAQGKKAVNNAPPQTSSSLKKLEYANQIINMVSQALFMAVNIGMLYKTGKEIQELKSRIGTPEEKPRDKAELKQAEDNQKVNETSAEQASENAEEISKPVEDMSDSDFSLGSEDASPATEASDLPDIEPPADLDDLKLSEDEADVADAAIEQEVKEQGGEPNPPDSEGGGEEDGEESGSMEDGENVLTTGLDEFAEDAA